MGIISAIGNTVLENLDLLLKSDSGLSEISLIDTIQSKNIKVGEIKITNEALAEKLELPENHNYTRTSLLGAIAAKEAFENAGARVNHTYKTGLISASTVGGMDKTELHFNEFASKPETQKYISSHIIGDSTQKIAEQLVITGFTTSISTACSSAANAIMLGARMIKAGKLDRVVVGGVDSLSKFTINGFKTLMILSDENCAPFDANRKGLNLGEAAAFLVLESTEIVEKENKKVLAYVTGYGNANDAFHQTAS
jgi:3-oxoacyl-(acyl-carrier-protein) synthase